VSLTDKQVKCFIITVWWNLAEILNMSCK